MRATDRVVTAAEDWHTAVARWFAEQGFAVLVVDGRGTPGRGVAWERAIRGDRLTPVLDDQADALPAAAQAALTAAGRPHTTLLLPGQGHRITRDGAADTLLHLERDFLATALGTDPDLRPAE